MLPQIIQGGMGVGVSGWSLAQAVSKNGGLGTLSGVAAENILARTLQRGDPGRHFQRALAAFPHKGVTERILERYYVVNGIPANMPFKVVPVFSLRPPRELIELTVVANFSLVWLAKEGHISPVSINYLEKVQFPHLYSVYGAMLAQVDAVTVGAGIPNQFPPIFSAYLRGNEARYRLTIDKHPSDKHVLTFNPGEFFGDVPAILSRPLFLPIVSSHVLAEYLAKTSGEIDGFIVESYLAGGHNAPPRGKLTVDIAGEPVYGERDRVNFERMDALSTPFWLAGAQATPIALREAIALGARGIQVGSIFALADESGLLGTFRKELRHRGYLGTLKVKTDLRASSTGFPFQVVQLESTVANDAIYAARKRRCDVCYLTALATHAGRTITRCPGEPVTKFVHKGGRNEDTAGVRCLCNGLLAAIGLGQPGEPAILTLGKDLRFLRDLMAGPKERYSVSTAMHYLAGEEEEP